MAEVQSDTFEVAWSKQIGLIIAYGVRVSPRGYETLEVLGTNFRVHEPLSCLVKHPARDINPRYALAEALWILSGSNKLELVAMYNKEMEKFSDDGEHLAGAYGPRLMSQMDYVLHQLINDKVTRQAVATIWTPNPEPSKDIPCTVSLQFLRRQSRYGDRKRDQLHLIVSMRSSDVWLGLVYDFPVFAIIQNMVAGYLDLDIGWLEFQFGSSHLYIRDYEAARNVLNSPQLGKSVSLPRFPAIIMPHVAEQILRDDTKSHLLAPPWRFFYDVIHQKRKADAWDVIESTVTIDERFNTK